MNVAELMASAGFAIDFESVAKWTSILNKEEERVRDLGERQAFFEKVAIAKGDPNKALDLIGLSADKAEQAMGASAKKSGVAWSNAILVLNQGLELAGRITGYVQRGLGAVRGMVEATGAQAAQAVELAAQLGMSAEAVQELGFASSQAGGSVEVMTVGLRSLSNQAQTAAKGGKDAARAFKDAGINAKDITSGKVPLDQALGQIADKFASMPDGAKKSALAMDLFGRQGMRLIPLLNEGSAGVGKLRQEARELGVVIDNDTAAALEGFGDETDKVKAQMDGLRNQAIAAVLPMLSELVKNLQDWIKANRELMVDALTAALKGFLYVMQGVGFVLEQVTRLIVFFTENAELGIAVLGGLAAAFLYMGATAAAAWLAAAWPVIAIAAAITGLILLFPYLVEAAEGAGRLIGRVADRIGDAFIAAGRGIMSVFRGIGSFFAAIGRGIRNAFDAVVGWIENRINDAIDVVNKMIEGFNAIPWVDNLSTIGRIGAASTPSTSGKTARVEQNINVNVSAPNADTEAVKTAVRESFKPLWDAQMRDAAQGVG